MKQSALVVLLLLALAACTPQPPPPAGAGTQPMTPMAYAGGSPNNTTSAFDGTYAGVSTQNISKGNTLDIAGGNAPIVCQDYGGDQPPIGGPT
jgi:hypothetical protein